MIIVKIVGGLGNQMFQYAYAKALETRGYKVKIDITVFETYKLHGGYQLDTYNINLANSSKVENKKYYKNNIIFKVLKKIGLDFSKRTKEDSLLFNDSLLKVKDNNYIDGYFQCEKYFKDIREILLKQFSINQEKSNYTKQIEKKIFESKHSYSLHIRRGDFVDNTNINIHGSCDLEYYQNAIEVINLKYEDTHCFIFSDDIDWCKQNLKIKNVVYIDSEEKRIPHEDIYLMSLCHHNIIANSSFSWWGAWLNQNEDKVVIAPKRWFANDELEKQSRDIVCDGWIRI